MPLYVEPLVDFPVGSVVPVGTFDRLRNAWVGLPNGRVIKVLSASASLDVTGAGTPSSPSELAALGIDPAEQQALAGLYAAGQIVWRARLSHWSDVAFAYPLRPTSDLETLAPQVPLPRPGDDLKVDAPFRAYPGGEVEVDNQILGQRLPILGTPFSLAYRSDRAPGRRAPYAVDIPASGATVPSALQQIALTMNVAGVEVRQALGNATGQSYHFEWDGRDRFGRPVPASQLLQTKISYQYPGTYSTPPPSLDPAFAASGPMTLTPLATRFGHLVSRESATPIGALDAQGAYGLGGWSLSAHHHYDPNAKILYLGTGDRRTLDADNRPLVLTRVAGNGGPGFAGDGGPARSALLSGAGGLATTPDGGLLVADPNNCRIRKIDRLGNIATVAGRGCDPAATINAEGMAATDAVFLAPMKAISGPDGSLFVLDVGRRRVWRVDAEGKLHLFAGNGELGHSGDGLPATDAALGPSNTRSPAASTLPCRQMAACSSPAHPGFLLRRVRVDGVIEQRTRRPSGPAITSRACCPASPTAPGPSSSTSTWWKPGASPSGPTARCTSSWPTASARSSRPSCAPACWRAAPPAARLPGLRRRWQVRLGRPVLRSRAGGRRSRRHALRRRQLERSRHPAPGSGPRGDHGRRRRPQSPQRRRRAVHPGRAGFARGVALSGMAARST